MPSLTSIVVPTVFNDEAVARVTRLTKANTGPSYELIVVDNGSKARGCVVASNQGLAAARGEVLVVMNDDCQPQPGWLEPLLAAVKDGVWLCSPRWRFARLGGHCLCFPREAYEATGGYDERYRHTNADHHLEMTIAELGKPICQVPQSEVLHDPGDPMRIHHRFASKTGNWEILPNTGAWYLEDQAVFESIWGDKRPQDYWPEDWGETV